MQALMMLLIAIIVHIILSGQVVLFGSMYRFGKTQSNTAQGDLVYLQDRKVITQKMTEYTKVTNLQSDFSQTMKDIDDAMVTFVHGTTTGSNALMQAYNASYIHGIALSNDGLVLVPGSLTTGMQAITRQGIRYAIKRIVPVSGLDLSYISLDIGLQKPLLDYTRQIISRESPFSLGQFLLSPSYDQGDLVMNLCIIRLVREGEVFCSSLWGEIAPQSLLFDSYGQLVGKAGVMSGTMIPLMQLTKEQHTVRSQDILTTTWLLSIVPKTFFSSAKAITPLSEGIYMYPKNQGWIYTQLLSGEISMPQIYTWSIVSKIADKYPVAGRSLQVLLQGIGSGEKIGVEK
jgi:hypothetical protein